MKHRILGFGSLLSLLLCAASVVLWVRSYMDGVMDAKGAGDFFAISKEGILSIFHRVPDGVTQLDFHYWICVLLFAACPALWLLLKLIRRRQSIGPHCLNCRYNLTGNTSGVCPECGSRVPDVRANA